MRSHPQNDSKASTPRCFIFYAQ